MYQIPTNFGKYLKFDKCIVFKYCKQVGYITEE